MPTSWRDYGVLATIALVGVALCSGSIADGLCLDDRAMLSTVTGPRMLPAAAPFDLFTLANGDPRVTLQLVDRGVLPWFAAPDLRVAFWRPVASFSHAVDFILFPTYPAWMHVQNLLWYAVLIITVGLLYRRLIGVGWAWILASALYAVHGIHGLSVGWISARNTLMGGTFAAMAWIAHDRWIRDGWTQGRYLAPVALAVALLSSEAAVTILVYLVAQAVLSHGDARSRALRRLAPCAVVTGAWLIVYLAMGKGARGSGVYLDPIREPIVFASALPGRVLTDMSAQLFGPSPHSLVVPIGWAAFVLACVPLAFKHQVAALFLWGFAASTFLVAGVSPDPRHLLHAGLGAFPVVALTLASAFRSCEPRPAPRAWRATALAAASLLTVLLGPLSALAMPHQAARAGVVQRAYDRVPLLESSVSTQGKTVLVVNAGDPIRAVLWLFPPYPRSSPAPRILSLAHVYGSVLVTRSGPRSLTIYAPNGHDGAPAGLMFHRPPLLEGTTLRLSGVTIRVTRAGGPGEATLAEYEFDKPLEDPSLTWLAWNGLRYAPFQPPPEGQTVWVDAQPP